MLVVFVLVEENMLSMELAVESRKSHPLVDYLLLAFGQVPRVANLSDVVVLTEGAFYHSGVEIGFHLADKKFEWEN